MLCGLFGHMGYLAALRASHTNMWLYGCTILINLTCGKGTLGTVSNRYLT